jgi:hypothetical protein
LVNQINVPNKKSFYLFFCGRFQFDTVKNIIIELMYLSFK